MAAAFPIDQSVLPHLRTRKALLVLDFQNDFLDPDGALAVPESEDLIKQTLSVVEAFRQSGAGDVIWVRSEFQGHRPAGGDQIVTSDTALLPSRSSSSYSRGRRRTSDPPADDPDGDDEAFLSSAAEAGDKPECVRPGTRGSELVSQVAAVVEQSGDMVLTKTHYSAFESTQLLMRLRTRLATELYICGSLTNVSVYATAVDAGRHGLAVTVVEDCCGHRGEVRHHNALQKLTQLIGSEAVVSDQLIAMLSPRVPTRAPAPDKKAPVPRKAGSPLRPGTGNSGGGSKSLPVRNKIQSSTEEVRSSSKPSSAPPSSELKDAAPPPVVAPAKQPLVSAAVQPVVADPAPVRAAARDGPEPASGTASEEPDAGAGPKMEAPGGKDKSPVAQKGAQAGAADPKDAATPTSPKVRAEQLKKHIVGAVSASASRVRRTTSQATPVANPVINTLPKQTVPDPASDERKSVVPEKAKAEPSAPATEGQDGEATSDDDAPVAKMKARDERPIPSEPLCEGDTTIYHDVLPPSVEEGIFERLRDEVRWMRMSHQGGEVPRLVCVQGDVDKEGNMPVYRHPADESPPLLPFSPAVVEVKAEVEKLLGHPLNHVLIQFYRSGNDYISEHSDKTLDIVKGSFICNVSLGAERTMIFRTKRADKDPSRTSAGAEAAADTAAAAPAAQPAEGKKRQAVRAQLPHNSLCRMGLQTNMRWLHAIRQDKRADRDKTQAELAFSGGRISLTFRYIGTYLNSDNTLIWGQGATSKERKGARPVINGQTPEAVKMLQCFGRENQSSDFDWDATYGAGFDVLHISNAPRFFSSGDSVVDMRIQLMLAEYGIAFAKGSMGPAQVARGDQDSAEAKTAAPGSADVAVKFIDNDADHSVVEGQLAIMVYLDALHGAAQYQQAGPLLAKRLTRFQRAFALLDRWKSVAGAVSDKAAKEAPEAEGGKKRKGLLRPLARELLLWDGYASETEDDYIADGEDATLPDFALWPVLYDMERACGGQESFVSELGGLGCEGLVKYYKVFKGRRCVMHVLKSQGDAGSQA